MQTLVSTPPEYASTTFLARPIKRTPDLYRNYSDSPLPRDDQSSHPAISPEGTNSRASTGTVLGCRGCGCCCPQTRRSALISREIPQTEARIAAFFKNRKCAVFYDEGLALKILSSALTDLSGLDNVNPALTRYGRKEPAPVLPLREEPDLLSWLETSGRLVEDEESNSPEVSTVEEEELSALMGEKEDYKADEENEENWED